MPDVGTPGTYGSSSTIPVLTTDTQGRVTAVVNTAIVGNFGSVVTLIPDGGNVDGVATSSARADHKHDIPAAAPASIGTSNSKGTATSVALSDHIHAHGAQTDGTLHETATPSKAGFLSTSDKTKLDHVVYGFLAYANASTQTTTQNNTAYTTITLDSDKDSFSNGLLTKSSATQFRTDFTGYVQISIKILAQNTSTNDRPSRFSVLKNGTSLKRTELRASSKTNLDRYTSCSGTWSIPCSDGDLFTLGFSNAEAVTDTIQVVAQEVIMTVKAEYQS